jgi:hypothetical protein
VADIPKEARFLALVEMLASGALHAMGKLADPNDPEGEAEVFLPQAQYMIAMLEAIEEKTKGNLTDFEKRALDTQLTNLRLTYVDEFNRQKKAGGGAKPDPKDESESKDGFTDKRSGR